MINPGFPLKRYFFSIAICGAGLALAWLANELTGLLVTVTGVSIFGGRRASLLSTAVLGLALAAFTLVVGWDSIVEREANLRFAVFLAVGLGVSGLVHLDQTASSSGHNERTARLIVESMPGLGWSTDPTGKFAYVSPSGLKYLGRTAEDLDRMEGKGDFIHPDDYDRTVASWRHSLKTGEPYENEHRIRRFDGTYRWFRNAAMPSRESNGRIAAWYGNTIDIHEQKTAEFALRRSEQRLQQMIDAVPALIWCTTPEGIPCYLNKRVTDVTGVTLKDMIAPDGSRSLTVVHPDDRAAMGKALARSFETGASYVGRYRQRRANGPHRWVESRAEPLRDESGAIVRWYGVSVEIDDLVTAQEALRDRERELSQLVDMVPNHVWRLAPDGEPTFFNKRMANYLGLEVADTEKAGTTRLEAVMETVHPDDVAEFRDILSRSLATGESFETRYRLRRADGVYRWMSSRAEPMRDQDGSIVQWYGICHDIDDQMHAEDALRGLTAAAVALNSCRSLDEVLGTITDRAREIIGAHMAVIGTTINQSWAQAVIAVSLSDKYAAYRDFDAKPDGSGIYSIVCDLNRPLRLTQAELEAHPAWRGYGNFAGRHPRLRGWLAAPLIDSSGRNLGLLQFSDKYQGDFTAEDEGIAVQLAQMASLAIGEARLHESLADSKRQLQEMLDAVPVRIWSATPAGEVAYFNKRYQDHFRAAIPNFEAREEPSIETLLQELIHPEDAPEVQRTLLNCFETGGGSAMRFRWREKDGAYRWAECRVEPRCDEDGEIVQWYGASIDIDDEVRAQEALRARELELSRLVDIVPVHIRRLTPEGEPVFFNKRLIDFLGLDVADLEKLGMSRLATALQTLVHPDDVTSVRKTVSHSLANGEPYAMKYRIRRADGAYRWVDGRAESVRDESGAIVQWYSVSFDIDDQVQAQEALRERERALSQLVETLPAMIECAAPDGESIYRSHQLREFLGYNLEELDGSKKFRLDGTLEAGVHPDDLEGLKEKYARSLSTGEPYARRHRLRRFDGAYLWVDTRAAPMRNAEGKIVQWNVICLDVDGEVRAQEELRLAKEKMARANQAASLAELSASIAHEVNQPLAAIVATSHACRHWLSADPPNLERAKITLDRIIRDANSASEVVSRIRSLFSQMGKTRSPTDMTEVIGEVCRLMAGELAVKNIEVETEFERRLPHALIDRVQMQQVLVNLIRNAIDALDTMADGTRLIRLRAVLDNDNAIRVEVQDLGPGMKEPEQALEPFFTTKKDGMGMGLAICRSIIEYHNGRLWATDNEPRGTTVAFTLPIQRGMRHEP